MRIHMVMDGCARAALLGTGRLAGSRERIGDESWLPAYRWMAARMSDLLPPPPPGVAPWPLWAWRRRSGRSKPRPTAWERRADPTLWLVSLDVPPERVLLSDFQAWHHPLNGWYLPDLRAADGGDAEQEAFDAELDAAGITWLDRPYAEPFGARVLASWERVLDVRDCGDVQATVWCVEAGMVVAEAPMAGSPVSGT